MPEPKRIPREPAFLVGVALGFMKLDNLRDALLHVRLAAVRIEAEIERRSSLSGNGSHNPATYERRAIRLIRESEHA